MTRDVVVRIEGGEKLERLARDKDFVRGPLQDFLNKSAFEVELQAKLKAPVDTGRLRASIATAIGIDGLSAEIGPNAEYGAFVEYGTRPHFPPLAAMQPWAQRHGFGPKGAFLVARAIAKRGTRAHPYMRPGLLDSIPAIKRYAIELGREIQRRWSRG